MLYFGLHAIKLDTYTEIRRYLSTLAGDFLHALAQITFNNMLTSDTVPARYECLLEDPAMPKQPVSHLPW